MEEEYILMGMSAYGQPGRYRDVYDTFVQEDHAQTWKQNFHAGIDPYFLKDAPVEDIAHCKSISSGTMHSHTNETTCRNQPRH